jgi:hypothetical protein
MQYLPTDIKNIIFSFLETRELLKIGLLSQNTRKNLVNRKIIFEHRQLILNGFLDQHAFQFLLGIVEDIMINTGPKLKSNH